MKCSCIFCWGGEGNAGEDTEGRAVEGMGGGGEVRREQGMGHPNDNIKPHLTT